MVKLKDFLLPAALITAGYFLLRGIGSAGSDLSNLFSGFSGGSSFAGDTGTVGSNPSSPSQSPFNPPGSTNPISNFLDSIGYGLATAGLGAAGGYVAVKAAPSAGGLLSRLFGRIAPAEEAGIAPEFLAAGAFLPSSRGDTFGLNFPGATQYDSRTGEVRTHGILHNAVSAFTTPGAHPSTNIHIRGDVAGRSGRI